MAESGIRSDDTAKPIKRRGPAKGISSPSFQINRERVIKISARLFAQNGYHATGITELCQATDLSRGALYHYIDSKQMLLYEICRTQVMNMNVHAAEIAAMDASAEDKLRRLACSLLRNISDHLDEWTVFFKEFANLEGERRKEIMTARDVYEAHWLSIVDSTEAARDRIEITLPLVVKGLLGMFNYSYVWLRPDGAFTPEQVADNFVEIILNGLRDERPGSTA